jgi:hypothetical protein
MSPFFCPGEGAGAGADAGASWSGCGDLWVSDASQLGWRLEDHLIAARSVVPLSHTLAQAMVNAEAEEY